MFLFLLASMFHHPVDQDSWIQEDVAPFDELILSWSGERPLSGSYQFFVRVHMDQWSEPLPYAIWGNDVQKTFSFKSDTLPLRVYQDAVSVLDGKKANGFEVFVTTDGNATLDPLRSLHVYTNGYKEDAEIFFSKTIDLSVGGLSQMALNHEKSASLCSPSATTAVLRFLQKTDQINPIVFAERVWDHQFEMFGNWILNTAEASNQLRSHWSCWVERMNGFSGIYQRLERGLPTVVSVRGPLVGSASPYQQGHLLVVKGFDASKNRVLCMDPAFANDVETHVSYPLQDFLDAWKRRGNVAYVFQD